MLADRIKAILTREVLGGQVRFMSYGEFGKLHGLPKDTRGWANKLVLDAVARQCLQDPSLEGLDLTYLLRSGETLYPGVVDGRPFEASRRQVLRCREIAQAIIDRFSPGTTNPY